MIFFRMADLHIVDKVGLFRACIFALLSAATNPFLFIVFALSEENLMHSFPHELSYLKEK